MQPPEVGQPTHPRVLRSDCAQLGAEVQRLRRELLEMAQANVDLQPLVLQSALASGALPKYSGDPTSDGTFDNFIADYRLMCTSFGMTEVMMARALGRCLTGHAHTYYKELVRATPALMADMAGLENRLRDHFRELTDGRRNGTSAFYHRKQMLGETVMEYYAGLEKLGKTLYPDPNHPIPPSQFLEKFIRGLKLQIKKAVLNQDPQTPEAGLRAAVKAEARQDYLADSEETHVAAVETTPALTKQMKELTTQVSNLAMKVERGANPYAPAWQGNQQYYQNHKESEGWPNPEHYFPQTQRFNSRPQFSGKGRFQPSGERRFNRKPAFSRDGKPLCFVCKQYGHYQTTCPAKTRRSQPNKGPVPTPVRNVAVRDETSTPVQKQTSPMQAGHTYLYLAVMCVMLPCTPVQAQEAMVCHTQTPGQLFTLPKPLMCNYSLEMFNQPPIPATYELYKHNVVQYDVEGWLCRAVKKTAHLLTYFFADEFIKEFKDTPIMVSSKQCREMVKTKMSPQGRLTWKTSGVWSTDHQLNYKIPSGGLPEYCKFHDYEATNYYIVKVRVYKQHGRHGFQSSGADVSHCRSYSDGECQLGKQAMIWKPAAKAQCKYVFYRKMEGRKLLHSWLSSDGLMALTHTSGETATDCGVHLNISDQTIPFRDITADDPEPTVDTNSTTSMMQPQSRRALALLLAHRLTKDPGPSPVLADELAAELQALSIRMKLEMAHTFRQNLQTVCENMKSAASLLQILALNHPTSAVRTLLNDTLLYSRAGNGILEVWKCLPVPTSSLVFLPQERHCTEEIPVNFTMHHRVKSGHLDPVTMVITHHGRMADCSMVSSVPLKLNGSLELYNRKTGNITKIGQATSLRVLSYHWRDEHAELFTPFIYSPVTMYSWEEMSPGSHLNALLKASAAQIEMMSLLAEEEEATVDKEDRDAAVAWARNIVGKGLASLVTVLRSPIFLWMATVCALVTVWLIWKVLMKLKHKLPIDLDSQLPSTRQWFGQRRSKTYGMPGSAEMTEMMGATDGVDNSLEGAIKRAAEIQLGLVCAVGGDDCSVVMLVKVNGRLGRFLLDSGSAITLVSDSFVRMLATPFNEEVTCPRAVSITGDPVRLVGELHLELEVGRKKMEQLFRILPECAHDGVIGMDCIKKWGTMLFEPQQKRLSVGGDQVPIEDARTPPLALRACENTTIPPRSMAVMYGEPSVPIQPGRKLMYEQHLESQDLFLSPRTLIAAAAKVPIRVINPGNQPLLIYARQKLGMLETVDQVVAAVKDVGVQTMQDDGVMDDLNLKGSTLTPDQQQELHQLLWKYQHLFAQSDRDLPGTNVVKHVIKVTDEKPIKQKAYRVPVSLRGELDVKLDELLESGIIAPSCSAWASPLVLVRKKDGGIRPCVDFRKLNLVTEADSHPLPHIDESLEFLTGAKFLTTLDLHSGYLQVPMEEQSKKYTAFVTSRGLFQWNYLPFGLRNAPATFSRMMNYVLSGLLFQSAILYLDDVLVASKTWPEHLKHLEEIFQRLDHYQLRLKMKKCCFARESLPYLGFLITTQGVRPDPDNVKKVVELPSPKTVTQTRSFIGLVNYYRRFIPDFAKIARPLYHLIKKETRFWWSPECQDAFERLKEFLTKAPLLVYPRFNRPFIITTDASNQGCGAVLCQQKDGQEHPIAYFSHKFSPTESRYETVEQELYAVVLACRHWRHYVYGHPVMVYSDQKSLSWGIRQSNSPRMMRWIQQLAEFDVKIYYRPGNKNVPADFLSRTHPPLKIYLMYDTKQVTDVSALFKMGCDGQEEDYFLKEQRKDPVLLKMMETLNSGLPRRDADRLRRHFYVKPSNGCLLHGNPGSGKFVVPEQLKSRILEEMHDSTWGAHLGTARTYDKIAQKYYWNGMKADVENWIASCKGCLTRKAPSHPTHGEMVPIHSHAPWHTVVVDIVGPLPRTNRGNKWILVIMDRFTRWPECVALRNVTAQTVARAFLSCVVTRHGCPVMVQSDRGAQFTSKVFEELSRMLGMQQKLSCAYRPQTQGLVERWNRTMGQMLRQYVNTYQTDWCSYLDLIMMAYRSSVHTSSGFTPSMLQYGRQMRLPTHLLVPEDDNKVYQGEIEYVADLHARLHKAFDIARENNHSASTAQKKYHDRSCNPSKLQAGDLVYLLRPQPKPGLTPKLQPKYRGPYQLLLVLGKNGLIEPDGRSGGRSQWVHMDHLRKAVVRDRQSYQYPDPVDLQSRTKHVSTREHLPPKEVEIGVPNGTQREPLSNGEELSVEEGGIEDTTVGDTPQELKRHPHPDVSDAGSDVEPPLHNYNLRRRTHKI